MTTQRLLVMTPPQDIEMRILAFRSELFSRLGYASALALPVIIPLFPLQKSFPVHRIHTTLSSHRFTGFPISGLKIVPISNSLFLSLRHDGQITACTNECKRILSSSYNQQEKSEPDPPVSCIPMFPGFFLAQNEKNSDEWADKVKNIHHPAIFFEHFCLSVCIIHMYAREDAWWNHCEWEMRDQIKSKKL